MNAKKAQTTDKSFTRPVAQKFQPFHGKYAPGNPITPSLLFYRGGKPKETNNFFVSRNADSCEFHTLKLFNRFHTPRLKTTFYVI